jgi:hypothetical protein
VLSVKAKRNSVRRQRRYLNARVFRASLFAHCKANRWKMLMLSMRRVLILMTRLTAVGSLLAASLVSSTVNAQGAADRLLLGVSVAESNACTIVKIEFNGRAQYLSHVPQASGDELRIQVAPLDEVAGGYPSKVGPEAIRAPSNPRAAIHAIEIERNGSRATLVINFTRIVTYKVAQGVDYKSLLVAIAPPGASAPCTPVQDAFPANEASSSSWKTVVAADQTEPIGDAQVDKVLADARQALGAGNADRAVQLLTKLVESGPIRVRQDALELLGDARARRGQSAHARTEYQEYLRQYPSGLEAERVRKKLAALEAGVPAAGGGSDTLVATAPSGQTIKLGGDGKSARRARHAARTPEITVRMDCEPIWKSVDILQS